jgi:membrane fusion protein, copper/silver efflux system
MKARHVLAFLLIAALAGAGGWFAARRAAPATAASPDSAVTAHKVKFYQSPMHPWIKSDKPGKCTICGMTLVPVYEGEAGISTDASLVTLAPSSAAVIGVQTAEVRRAPLTRTLRVAGVIDDEESRHRYLSAYTDARIEKLFVHTTGVEVVAGQPLAVVYSPELLTARQEFHALAVTPALATSPLLAAAREKLRRLGLLDTQIDALAAAGEVDRDTEILAPLTGTVVARSETAYAGGYVKAGEMLFAIGDFAKMWFIFDAYEPDLPSLRVGQSVVIDVPSLPGAPITAPITFIDPNLDAATRTAKVRVVVGNAERQLRHRLTAYGRVAIESPEALIAPRSAVLFTQRNPVVYVELADHTYAPRTVKTGLVGDDSVEILSGLSAGDKVVTQGALLLDGQAQLAHASDGGGPSERPAPSAVPGDPAITLATADAAAALAADDLVAYAKLLPGLVVAVHGSTTAPAVLHSLASALVAHPDLKSARNAFEPFSSAVADLVRARSADQRDGLHVFECPMAPATGKARWLQRDASLKNPFFGSTMIDCGSELR